MKPCLTSIAVLASLVCSGFAAQPLPRSTPEAQGVASQSVCDFIAAVDQIDTLHSIMIVRHGKVIAEGWWSPEAPDKPHVLWSLSKSFDSTAVGFAVAEGKLSVDDPVLKFFPKEAPANPSENLQAMKVRDLLTMSCGHEQELKIQNHNATAKEFLAHPVPLKPGTHFQYNTYGSYMLSAIVTKVTGQTELEYLKPRLFEPLGIENPKWDASPEGPSLGGYGLYLCTEDIAKFGLLYLQKGQWNGKQLLPASWVEQATSKQVPNEGKSHTKLGIDWNQGYGFQFWRCTHDAYRGDGRAGQLCLVIPAKDVVVVMTAEANAFQQQLNAVWEKLLPAFGDSPLPENADAQAKLKEITTKLVAHPKKP